MFKPWQRPEIIAHCRLLTDSYFYWTQQSLVDHQNDTQLAKSLYEAPFVLVSHGNEHDPIFNYANECAQALWKLSWVQFTGMPSRASAEPIEENRRQELLRDAQKQGVIRNYQGTRISSDGRRFYIINVTLWNVLDAKGTYHGQAAKFDHWEFID